MKTVSVRNSTYPVIERETLDAIFGGAWPTADGFDWSTVETFRILEPGIIQGFDTGEPVGPTLFCSPVCFKESA